MREAFYLTVTTVTMFATASLHNRFNGLVFVFESISFSIAWYIQASPI